MYCPGWVYLFVGFCALLFFWCPYMFCPYMTCAAVCVWMQSELQMNWTPVGSNSGCLNFESDLNGKSNWSRGVSWHGMSLSWCVSSTETGWALSERWREAGCQSSSFHHCSGHAGRPFNDCRVTLLTQPLQTFFYSGLRVAQSLAPLETKKKQKKKKSPAFHP